MSIQMFIFIASFILGIFGFWGNGNIILATIRRKDFQSKCGMLIAILACGDTVCIAFVWHNSLRSILPVTTYRSACFWTISPYLFVLNFQSCIMCSIASDRLFAICAPIKYRLMSTKIYIIICIAPGVFFGFATVIYGAIALQEDEIDMCNPSFALPQAVNTFNNRFGVAVSVVTLCIYAVSLLLLQYKRRQMRRRSERGVEYSHLMQQQKVMRTITLVVVVFLCSWFYAHLSVFIASTFGMSGSFLDFAMRTVTVPAMFCYASNYYIYLWRGRDYRRAFKEQFKYLYSCKSSGSQVSTFRTSGVQQQSSADTFCAQTVQVQPKLSFK